MSLAECKAVLGEQNIKPFSKIGMNEMQKRVRMLKDHLEFPIEDPNVYYRELKAILLRGHR